MNEIVVNLIDALKGSQGKVKVETGTTLGHLLTDVGVTDLANCLVRVNHETVGMSYLLKQDDYIGITPRGIQGAFSISAPRKTRTLDIWVKRERLSDGQPVYVALCLELDMACQGATVEEAVENVTDAVTSFFEVASPSEIERRLPNTRSGGVFLTRIEVPVGQTADLVGA